MRTPANDPPPSEITPEGLYLRRRELMRNALLFGATATTVGGSLLWLMNGIRADPREAAEQPAGQDLAIAERPRLRDRRCRRRPTDDVTTYNNFYEFGTRQGRPGRVRRHAPDAALDGPRRRARSRSRGTIDIDDLLKWFPLEERDLPHALRRGVVDGDSLGRVSAARAARAGCEPTSRAKYVAFTTLLDPEQMPGQRRRTSTGRTSKACASTKRCIR